MENEIVKLFEEFDSMTRHDYDQMRVTKVRQHVEKYQRITQEVVLKLHEKTVKVKINELNNLKEDFQMAKSTDLTLSKRIQEVEIIRNQVTDQKTLQKGDLNLNSETKSDQVHEGERPYKCEQCFNAFKEKAALQKHIYKLHTGKKNICM